MTLTRHRSRRVAEARSRSPHRTVGPDHKRSPLGDPTGSKQSHPSCGARRPERAAVLPFDAAPLSKHQLAEFRAMFGLYLDIQKQLVIDDLSDEEVRGRWKSFVRKWNLGELAEGWYHPNTLEKAKFNASNEDDTSPHTDRHIPSSLTEDESDDTYGPKVPPATLSDEYRSQNLNTQGPSRATTQDLLLKHETSLEEAQQARKYHRGIVRLEKHTERRLRQEQLDEIAPRAEGGTRERQLEKKREKAWSNREFAALAHENADVEIQDSDMMGGGHGLDELKQMKQAGERKRTEREIRREEQLAARRADREKRVQAMRMREEETMGALKELANARFGGAT